METNDNDLPSGSGLTNLTRGAFIASFAGALASTALRDVSSSVLLSDYDLLLEAVRPEDFAVVRFGIVGMKYVMPPLSEAFPPPFRRLVQCDTAKSQFAGGTRITAILPPQHVLEEADPKKLDDGIPPKNELAGETRLVLAIPPSTIISWGNGIDVTLAALLTVFADGKYDLVLPQQLNTSPNTYETAVVFPTGLVLRPFEKSLLTFAANPRQTHYDEVDLCHPVALAPPDIIELWHARFEQAEGTLFEQDDDHAYFTGQFAGDNSSDSATCPSRTDLAQISHDKLEDVVNSVSALPSANGGSNKLAKVDGTIDATKFILTSLGACVDLTMNHVSTPADNLELWQQRTELGRDSSYKFVYSGRLLPFGFKASLIIFVERKIDDQDKPQNAYLHSHVQLRIDQPMVAIPLDNARTSGLGVDPNSECTARVYCFKAVSLKTTLTPDLDINASIIVGPAPCESIPLLIKPILANGQEFVFPLVFTDFVDRTCPSTGRFLWVSDRVASPNISQGLVSQVSSAIESELRGASNVPKGTSDWAAGTAVSVGNRVSSGGVLFECVRQGTTGSVRPPFSGQPVSKESNPTGFTLETGGGTAAWVRITDSRAVFQLAFQRYAISDVNKAQGQLAASANYDVDVLAHSFSFDSAIDTTKGSLQVRDGIRGIVASIPSAQVASDVAVALLDIPAEAYTLTSPAVTAYNQLFAKVVSSFPIDFQNAPVPVGAATVRQSLIALTREHGAIAGLPTSDLLTQLKNIEQGEASLKNIFGELQNSLQSKLLGLFNLSDILPIGQIKLPDAPKFIVKNLPPNMPPAEVVASYTYTGSISENKALGITKSDEGKDSQFTFNAEIRTPLNANVLQPKRTLTCDISNIKVSFPPKAIVPASFGGLADLIFITIDDVRLDMSGPPKLSTTGVHVSLNNNSVLAFLEELLARINPGSGPAFSVDADSISVLLGIKAPTIGLGAVTIQNLIVDISLVIPFNGANPVLRINVGSRKAPFAVAVGFLGGGGYFALTFDPSDPSNTIIEGGIEVGAFAAINIVDIITGSVQIAAGVAMAFSANSQEFTGFLLASGSVNVLGLISASMYLYMSFDYKTKTKDGKRLSYFAGSAEFHAEVHILFFSASVSVSVGFHVNQTDNAYEIDNPGQQAALLPESTVAQYSSVHAIEQSRNAWTRYCKSVA